MASKSAQQSDEVKVDVEETLEQVDKTLERVKSLYEQYFLGIQKQPPTFLHTDLDRKLRDLSQIQIRNTALRYRFVTLQQKFGSYNSYWRRTLRQIENGTYARSLHKLGRKAVQTGEEIPEEILAAMPKRMREQVRRDREAALALARQRNQVAAGQGDFYDEYDDQPAARVDSRGAHLLNDGDADLDLDAYFRQVEAEEEEESTHAGPPPQLEPEELVTPPRATQAIPPAPTPPSAPAPLRASTLGFGPRPTSPNLRVPVRPGTDPGATPTPAPFTPLATPPGGRPAQPRASTQAGPGAPPVPSAAQRTQAMPTVASTPPAPQPPSPQRTMAMPTIAQRPPAPPAAQPPRPGLPAIPQPNADPNRPVVGAPPLGRPPAGSFPSQVTRPNPIAAGASAAVKPAAVETMAGPFAREPSTHVPPRRSKRDTDLDQGQGGVDVPMEPTPNPQPPARPSRPIPAIPAVPPQRPTPPPQRAVAPTPTPPQRPSQPARPPAQRPPAGMTDDDVNALYAKYVKAKEMVGEATGPQTYGKLLNTINAQAPKIMEQYKAKGVDFSVVVKDNQVIIRAKPKT